MLGKSGEHFNFVGFNQDTPVEFLSFFTDDYLKNIKMNQYYQVLFTIGIDFWRGKRQIKLRLVDMKKV